MDLKMRFLTTKTEQPNRQCEFASNMNAKPKPQGTQKLNKYARRIPSKNNNNRNNEKTMKSNINRYYHKGQASKNQYQRYFLNTENVFYEDRPALKNLKNINFIKKISVVIWITMAVIYLATGRIQPFKGKCPANADCIVFIRCHEGYELNQNQICVVKQSIIDSIQQLCKSTIQQLKYEYGEQDCQQGSNFKIPQKNIQEIYSEIYNSNKKVAINRVQNFFDNYVNQKQFNFKFTNQIITPNKKQYTLRCEITQLLRKTQIQLLIIFIIFLLIILVFIINLLQFNRKAYEIYNFLKLKTLQENKINVTHIKCQLEEKYGSIDQKLWTKIDLYRTQQRLIGYFEDDFLYWKPL